MSNYINTDTEDALKIIRRDYEDGNAVFSNSSETNFDNLIADEITEKREVPETERVRDRENLLIYVINLDFTYQMALVDLGNDTTAW